MNHITQAISVILCLSCGEVVALKSCVMLKGSSPIVEYPISCRICPVTIFFFIGLAYE